MMSFGQHTVSQYRSPPHVVQYCTGLFWYIIPVKQISFFCARGWEMNCFKCSGKDDAKPSKAMAKKEEEVGLCTRKV